MVGFLAGRTVGFLVAKEGVDQEELTGPLVAIAGAGARALVISTAAGEVVPAPRGVPAPRFAVDRVVNCFADDELDALVLPDGLANSTALRRDESVAAFVAAFTLSGRPIGAFGHAVWSLLDADLLAGRHVTSHSSIRRDVERAGGRWHDRRVVVDDNVITSRDSGDMEAFNTQLIAFLDR